MAGFSVFQRIQCTLTTNTWETYQSSNELHLVLTHPRPLTIHETSRYVSPNYFNSVIQKNLFIAYFNFISDKVQLFIPGITLIIYCKTLHLTSNKKRHIKSQRSKTSKTSRPEHIQVPKNLLTLLRCRYIVDLA